MSWLVPSGAGGADALKIRVMALDGLTSTEAIRAILPLASESGVGSKQSLSSSFSMHISTTAPRRPRATIDANE
jgi:hypothetical protein